MLKKWMFLICAVGTVALVAGCGKKNQESTENIQETVVAPVTTVTETVESEVEELPPLVEEEPEESEVPEEAEVDPAVYEPAELVCSIPDGFKPAKGEEGFYVHNDLSSISYVISESTEDVTEMDKKEYKEMLEADFYENYGDEVDVNISRYSTIKVDGRKGLKVKLDYEFKGTEYEELIYMIYNGNESHIVCYTQEKDGRWAKDFESSGDSITLKPLTE